MNFASFDDDENDNHVLSCMQKEFYSHGKDCRVLEAMFQRVKKIAPKIIRYAASSRNFTVQKNELDDIASNVATRFVMRYLQSDYFVNSSFIQVIKFIAEREMFYTTKSSRFEKFLQVNKIDLWQKSDEEKIAIKKIFEEYD